MIWEEYQSAFQTDGDLLHIYIKNVDLNDWQSFIDFLRSTEATLDYSVEGNRIGLPSSIAEVVYKQESFQLLSIGLDGVTVQCEFQVPDEIILDLEPGQIDNENKARVVFRLMSTAGRKLNKPVILGTAHFREQPIFKYEPGTGIRYLAMK